MKTFTESMLNQCRKYMFNFFDYLPTKYQASARDWQVRNSCGHSKTVNVPLQLPSLSQRKSASSLARQRVTWCLSVSQPAASGK